MYYYIKGKLTYKDTSTAVVEAGGVGYKMTVSGTTLDALPALDSDVKLYTYLSVREDGIELFGFISNEESEAFKLLIGVSGVGPKAAISILSLLTPEKFAVAVASEDAKLLSKANGVGAKTAARIVLELKDKDKLSVLGSAAPADIPSASSGAVQASSGALSDAMEALAALGYTRPEILNALKGLDTAGMSVDDIFKAAMKQLQRLF